MRNLEAVVLASGPDLEHVLKVTIYVVDLSEMAIVNATYDESFDPGLVPARLARPPRS